jgi:hypothetical protein
MDIQTSLQHLDRGDMRLYDDAGTDQLTLTRDLAWIIPQWMTGATNENTHKYLILAFDEFCNPGWATFANHPGLRSRLLATLHTRGVRHKFYPPGKKKVVFGKLFELLQAEFDDIRPDEVVMWCRGSTLDELTAIMDRSGTPIEERGDLCKLYENVKQRPR